MTGASSRISRPLNQRAREAQAECLRRFLARAEGYTQAVADECAQHVLRGEVEYDPAYLESLPGRCQLAAAPGVGEGVKPVRDHIQQPASLA